VDRFGGFLSEESKRSGGATWEGVDVSVRGFTVAVLDRREDNATQLELLASLEAEGVPGGELHLYSVGADGGRASSLTLEPRPGEDFLDAYDLAAQTAEATPAYADAVLTGRSDDGDPTRSGAGRARPLASPSPPVTTTTRPRAGIRAGVDLPTSPSPNSSR
jgi:hypothetical protein